MMSRFRSIAAILLLTAPVTVAAFSDVEPGSWYERAVQRFDSAGYLEQNVLFRPAALVPRADLAALIVRLQGKTGLGFDGNPLFDDVDEESPYFETIQAAGTAGWLLGDGDCIMDDTCLAEPARIVNRAEAAAMIERAFGLAMLPRAPEFPDAPPGNWFSLPLQIAGSHCLLRGDDVVGTVRPEAPLNRAEMLTILLRVYAHIAFPDCREDVIENTLLPLSAGRLVTASSSSVTAASSSSSSSATGTAATSSSPRASSSSSSPISPVSTVSSSSVSSTSLSSSSTGAQSPDPTASSMQADYYDYLTQMAYLILQAKNYTADTSPNMFRLLNQRVLLIEQYNNLLLIAQVRPLTALEKQSVTQVSTALATNLTELNAAQGM